MIRIRRAVAWILLGMIALTFMRSRHVNQAGPPPTPLPSEIVANVAPPLVATNTPPAGPPPPLPRPPSITPTGGDYYGGPTPSVDPGPESPPAPGQEPEFVDLARARSILNLGKNHEKDRRIKPAVRCYSEVANGFPGSAEADEAMGRIKALGQVVISDALPAEIRTPSSDRPPPRKRNIAGTQPGGGSSFGGIDLGGGESDGGSSSHCGAMTTHGQPCRNRVVGDGYCYLHR